VGGKKRGEELKLSKEKAAAVSRGRGVPIPRCLDLGRLPFHHRASLLLLLLLAARRGGALGGARIPRSPAALPRSPPAAAGASPSCLWRPDRSRSVAA